MKQFLKDYFTFGKRERIGIFVLCLIIILLLFAPTLLGYFIKKESNFNYSEFESEINNFLERKKSFEITKEDIQKEKPKSSNILLKPFPFDPNSTSEKEWKEMGMPSSLVKTILNYTSKGGKFYKKEDFKKIWGMEEKLYITLEPFIILEENKILKKEAEKEKSIKTIQMVELNSADSFQLVSVKGIGPSFASRILKYRELLGGFLHVEQLYEVYNFTEEMYIKICPQVEVNSSLVKKININKCNIEELMKHPYLKNWNIANSIIRYREKHGKYSSITEIQNSDLVNEELYLKLAAYLTIE